MARWSSISVVALSAIAALLAGACDKEHPVPGKPQQAAGVPSSAAPATVSTDTQPARQDPCSFVTAARVTGIVGELTAPPHRGRSFDHSEPAENGTACVYTVKTAARGELVPALSVEVRSDAVAHEVGFHIRDQMERNIARQFGWSSPQSADSNAPADNGWDFRDAWPDEYFGRLGSLGISIGIEGFEKTPWEAIDKLAALVRDNVPDRPFASMSRHDSRKPDPCTLLRQADVEPVAGKLSLAPYRSEDDTPLAAEGGSGCSYYVTNHHVLTIHPQWSMGKQLFAMLSRLNGTAGKVVGLSTDSDGSLFGSWDQASERADGALMLLKGDRMLTLNYRGANITREDALKLAEIAVQHLGG